MNKQLYLAYKLIFLLCGSLNLEKSPSQANREERFPLIPEQMDLLVAKGLAQSYLNRSLRLKQQETISMGLSKESVVGMQVKPLDSPLQTQRHIKQQ